jgi:spore germination protein YaaH
MLLIRSLLRLLPFLPLLVTPLIADDGTQTPSVHRQFMMMYRDGSPVTASAAPAGYVIRPIDRNAGNAGLKKEVFGYLPYWFANRWAQVDMRLVSTIAYFSGEIAADGSIGTTHGWPKISGDPSATADVVNMINAAHTAGVKVVLCFTNFTGSEIDAIVSNAIYRNTFIQQSLAIVRAGNGDGININFEGINSSSKAALTQFMNALADSFHTNIPGSQVSCAPTDFDTRSGDWDLAALSAKVDLFFFQGYGYGWSGGPTATPVGLLPNTSFWGSTNSTTLFNFALARIPAAKVVLGVPHFGYRWPTTTGDVKSATAGTGVAIYYPDALGYAANYGRQWEVNALNPWYRYQANGQWYQGWYDDPESMSYKYQFVLEKNLRGVGMWSLGMDGNNKDIWNMLATYMTDSGYVPRAPSAPVLAAVKDTSRPSDPRILVRWRSSGTPAAAGFRLYLSQDPAVWPATPYLDEAVLGPSLREKEIGGLSADVTYYIKLVAVDSLRVRISDTSDTYAVRVGSGTPFLVVDGFDRTTGSFASAHHDFGAQYGDALAANGAHFDCVDNDAVQAGSVQLASYKGVFWFLGDESTADQSLNTAEQGLIRTYLEQGGRLFITGSELGYDLGRSASPDYSPVFYADYMKATYQGDKASTSTYTGASGSAFAGISGTFGSVYPEDYPDYIAPAGGAIAALTYSASQTAAVQYEGVFGTGTTAGKLVNVGFAVETIGSAAARAALIGRAITFFGGASGVPAEASQPAVWSIDQNFPNPFNPVTRIVVHVGERRLTTVTVFDVLGRQIATLLNEVKDPGIYSMTFDGSHLASGVYYCRMHAGEFVGTLRMVLTK